MKNYKILFLTGHRKSGTSMLHNLFDGHEDFLVYPNDIAILYAYYPSFIGKSYSFEFKKKRLLKIIRKTFQNIKENNAEFNKNYFIQSIKKNLNKKNIDKIELILKLIIKKYILFSKKKKFKYFVIKETSMSMHINMIKKWFKNIKFIQIVRDPRDNFSSLSSGLLKHYSKLGENKKILLSSMINRASLDFNLIEFNKKLLGNQKYYLLKFEKLVNYPKKELKKICTFLNVKFNNVLLYPSILGKRSKGNSFENKNLYYISKENVKKWKKRLNKEEIEVIEFYFRDIIKKLNYPKIKKINVNSISNYYTWLNKTFYFKDSYK